MAIGNGSREPAVGRSKASQETPQLVVSESLPVVPKRFSAITDHLLSDAANDEEQVRLLTVSTKESGAWLRARPVSAYGLRMDDAAVRVAVGLRLGTPVSGPRTVEHTWTPLEDMP